MGHTDIIHIIASFECEILGISESWLTPDIDSYIFPFEGDFEMFLTRSR